MNPWSFIPLLERQESSSVSLRVQSSIWVSTAALKSGVSKSCGSLGGSKQDKVREEVIQSLTSLLSPSDTFLKRNFWTRSIDYGNRSSKTRWDIKYGKEPTLTIHTAPASWYHRACEDDDLPAFHEWRIRTHGSMGKAVATLPCQGKAFLIARLSKYMLFEKMTPGCAMHNQIVLASRRRGLAIFWRCIISRNKWDSRMWLWKHSRPLARTMQVLKSGHLIRTLLDGYPRLVAWVSPGAWSWPTQGEIIL